MGFPKTAEEADDSYCVVARWEGVSQNIPEGGVLVLPPVMDGGSGVPLNRLFNRLITAGSLTVLVWGRRFHFGDGSGKAVTIHLHDRWAALKIALNPELYVGEAYMDGRLTVEQGDIADFLDLCGRNFVNLPRWNWALPGLFGRIVRLLRQFNPPKASKRNVAHHYDLPPDFYRLFLDEDMQYSCAFFAKPGLSLEEAQREKKRHLLAKLVLTPDARVLDIGCGFGGLALFLAAEGAANVTGITLSVEQHAIARQRAAQLDLGDRVDFQLQDYRSLTGRFDRIVSVGMFEHVGVPYYEVFFKKIADLLTDDGVAVLHSIGRMDRPGTTNAWIRKYIFPGGYVPALSEVTPAIESTGLWITDIEIIRLHYAETLRQWRARFNANRELVLAHYGDERFYRMWDFYLAGSEMSFVHGGLMVFQIQLAKRVETVPLTRGYLRESELAPGPEIVADAIAQQSDGDAYEPSRSQAAE